MFGIVDTCPDLWSIAAPPERIEVARHLRLPGGIDSRRVAVELHPAGGKNVAVVKIVGVIGNRPSPLVDVSSMKLRAEISRLAHDRSVKTIVLDIESPGGTVTGAIETTAAIREARRMKRVIACINCRAGGEAYQFASQANEIVASPSSMVGGLGIQRLHVDHSRRLEQDGLRATFIASSPGKVAGNALEPLDDETRAIWQREVNGLFAEQVADIAKGRDVSRSTVRIDYGDGWMFGAQEARRRGMVDRVKSFDNLLRELTGNQSARRGMPARRSFSRWQIRGAIPFGEFSGKRDDGAKVIFEPGSFANVLKRIEDKKDICVAKWLKHDNVPFASTGDGSLRLLEGPVGLEFIVDVPADRERMMRMAADFVSGASFSAKAKRFVKRTERATGCPVRLVEEWETLKDITLTADPAFVGSHWRLTPAITIK